MKKRRLFEFRLFVYSLCAVMALAFPCSSVFADDDDDDGEIEIEVAKFRAGKHLLKVTGELDDFDDDDKQLVRLFDADSGFLLAKKKVEEDFRFKVTDFSGMTPPCRIRVSAGGQTVTKKVKNAPSNCSQPSIILMGVVRDSVIPYATVTVIVGGVTYTTVADENGEFAIEIATIDVDALVSIQSSGTTQDGSVAVNMASIAGSFSQLVEDADGDGVVDGTENPNINNTPFTTALFVLVGEVTTSEELDAAKSQVDGTELLQTAAVIKAIVDGGVPIPTDPDTGEPYENILEFISDSEVDGGGQTPIENFIASNPEEIEDAIEEIVNDPAIVPAFVEGDIPERYYVIPAAIEGFLARSGSMLEFNFPVPPDTQRTGTFGGIEGGGGGDPISNPFEWSITAGGQLHIDLTSNPFTGETTLSIPASRTTPDIGVCNDTAADAAAPTGCKCSDFTAALNVSPYELYGNVETRSLAYTRLAVSGSTEFVRGYEDNYWSYNVAGMACEEVVTNTYASELRNEDLIETNPFDALVLESSRMAIPIYFDIGVRGWVDWDPGLEEEFWNYDDAPRTAYVDLVSFESTSTHCGTGWQDASTLYASQSASDSTFDLCWRVVGPGQSRTIDGEVVSKEGDLEFDYGDGWIQIVRRLDQMGPQTGLFHDFWNTNTLERFGTYDVGITVDESLQFTAPMMLNNPNEFWNGMVNGWHPGNFTTDGGGNLVHNQPWGWQFRTGNILYNGYPGNPNSGQVDGWEILGADLTLDTSYTLPEGAMRLNRHCWFSRFWVPLATEIVTDPLYTIALPNRTRLYVLEFEFGRDCGTETGFTPRWGVGPRINYEEVATGTPGDVPST